MLAGDPLGKVDKVEDEDDEPTDLINYDDVNDAADDWQSVSEFNHFTEQVEQKKIKANQKPKTVLPKKKKAKGKSKE